jgi:galactokinase
MGRALLAANDLTFPLLEFAEAMARAERYTGTQGGGMDQAISAGAREGHAARIEFDPLGLTHTRVPGEWRFVVAHTLVRAEKSGAAQETYNLRTRECREALDQIARALPSEILKNGLSYSSLLKQVCIQDLVDLAESRLEGRPLKRFRHVVTEGTRVYDAEQAMMRNDRLTFGLLMNASHESLRDDYQVSSGELNALVDLALESGADGARLTGAGFGGCMVALTVPERVEGVLDAFRSRYYRDRGPSGQEANYLFVARAAPGASVDRL